MQDQHRWLYPDSRGAENGAPTLISVVVVNFNGREYLAKCLSSVAAQTHPACEIIVVDNASKDDSVAWMESHFPEICVVRSERNLGFAAGNNVGIRASHGDLIATLNNDTEVEPDYLTRLSEPMCQPRVGMCAPLMLDFNHRNRIDASGIAVDRAGFAWNRKAGARADHETSRQTIFGACAGAALYRRAMLDEIGLFDEDYFGFYEDVDLAWRARTAGWTCVLAPAARVYHVHGGTFRDGSEQKLYLLARNRWWTVVKNYPLPSLAWNLPLVLGADLASLVRALAVYHSYAPFQGRLDAIRGFSRMWKKRGQLEHHGKS